jgi:phage baseplate assembly protein gpV
MHVADDYDDDGETATVRVQRVVLGREINDEDTFHEPRHDSPDTNNAAGFARTTRTVEHDNGKSAWTIGRTRKFRGARRTKADKPNRDNKVTPSPTQPPPASARQVAPLTFREKRERRPVEEEKEEEVGVGASNDDNFDYEMSPGAYTVQGVQTICDSTDDEDDDDDDRDRDDLGTEQPQDKHVQSRTASASTTSPTSTTDTSSASVTLASSNVMVKADLVAAPAEAIIVKKLPGLLIAACVFTGLATVMYSLAVVVIVAELRNGVILFSDNLLLYTIPSTVLGLFIYCIFLYRHGKKTIQQGRSGLLFSGIVAFVLSISLGSLGYAMYWEIQAIRYYAIVVLAWTSAVATLFCLVLLALGQNNSSRIKQPTFIRRCRSLQLLFVSVVAGSAAFYFVYENEYHGCPLTISQVSNLGDGVCSPEYNTEECGWDGGDCLSVDGYPLCTVEYPVYIGDGLCDGGAYATEECGWDGGDCKTEGTNCTTDMECASNICDLAATQTCQPWPIDLFPNCTVEEIWRIGDGNCDVAYNVSYTSEECGFDGGDCHLPGSFCANPVQCTSGLCDFETNTCV